MAYKALAQTKWDVAEKSAILTFTNSDLNGNKELVVTHRIPTNVVKVSIFDPTGNEMPTANIVTTTSKSVITIAFGGSLASGNHLAIIKFYLV